MEPSHFLMNGGKLFIKHNDIVMFHEQYIKDLSKGKICCYVEKKTPIFKFFIDFDYKGDSIILHDDIITLGKQFIEILRASCYVALSTPRKVGNLWKTGIHFHFPSIKCSTDDALSMRDDIIYAYPLLESYIDKSVYKTGLRMLWSHKYQDGVYYEPYKPYIHISIVERITPLPRDPPALDLLNIFSIRTNIEQAEEKKSHNAPNKLESFIRENMINYSDVVIQKTIVTKSNDYALQTNSKYCPFKGEKHTSNHVWFLIRDNILSVRCHDPECPKTCHVKTLRLPPSLVKELETMIPKTLNDNDSLWKGCEETREI